ncbi:MAG: hypothetical protein AUH81_09145 [Candidatus Rokubacteria bacterium 13_1_40CM_4_69_5]|nr:MAG: hypothetical protein AUH81_09145 [Candidatus Rokubacteria bacterium 13_1_40CM_4_69_5]
MGRVCGGGAAALVGLTLVTALAAAPVRADPALEVVATGVPRPLQLAVDGRSLVVLSPGARGDVAGEIYRLELGRDRPVDLARQPRVRIPFPDARMATFGSLAVHPITRELFLGEENGGRVFRMTLDERLHLFATGLNRLAGGGTLACDGGARLLIVDHVDPRLSQDDERVPPGFEQFREEDYRGPLVFRLSLDADIPGPRRLTGLAPLFPRAWGGKAGGGLLPRLVAVAPLGGDDVAVLTSGGDLFRLTPDGRLTPFARLPRGQYVRINMASAPDGTLYVSGGFWVAQLFRVSRDGTVSVVASNLADPQGVAVDARGDVYLAESSFHRIVRVRP